MAAAIMRKIPKKGYNLKYVALWKNQSISESQDVDDIYKIEIGRRHNDILTRFKGELDEDQQGFYTSYGRFVTREEAVKIALKSGQLPKHQSDTIWLFSEDLW